MKLLILFAIVIVGAVIADLVANDDNSAIPATAETGNTTLASTPTSTSDISTEGYTALFNEYREENGLAPLTFTDDLNERAELRLAEIQVNFSHTSRGGYNRHLAENIAMSTGYLDNQGALEMWQGSAGHRANMLDPSYKYSGYAAGGGYAIQLFTSYPTINGEPQLPSGWYWAD